MKERYRMDLQLFADVDVTTDAGLSAEMKTYYSALLIDDAKPELVHDQFGQKKPIPKNGGKVIEFRRYTSLPKALTPLTEGVTPSRSSLNVETITAEVRQYGDYIGVSDILVLTAIDNNIVEATRLLGSQAGRTLDTITREVVNSGTNVMYAPKDDGTPVLSRANIDETSVLTMDVITKAVAQLRGMNAKPIEGGKYVAVVHPYTANDLMKDGERWRDVYKYADPENILEGELGEYGGVRFVGTSESKIWGGAGSGGAAVYSTLVIGANAYGVTEVEGGGLQHIAKQLGSAGTADPLNQRATVGWKALKTAEILCEEYMVRIESGCPEFGNAQSN